MFGSRTIQRCVLCVIVKVEKAWENESRICILTYLYTNEVFLRRVDMIEVRPVAAKQVQ